MSEQELAIEVAEMRIEVREIGKNTEKNGNTLKTLDKKITEFLLKDAYREGESKGIKRTAIVLSTAISLLIAVGGIITSCNVI